MPKRHGKHFPASTVSAAFYCSKCGRQTQHRIDNHRRGPCLECMARLEAEHRQCVERETEQSGFDFQPAAGSRKPGATR